MLNRKVKAAFYYAFGPAMLINGLIYRSFRAPRGRDNVRVHLGPGQENYLDGWINVDANIFSGKADLWYDLRNPLPFHNSSVDAVYSHHVIEHLSNMEEHFKDIYRCLRPGGVYRVGGPNGDSAIAKFLENDKEWFSDFPDNRVSIGGRLENFIFCKREHVTILTYSFLEELLTAAGFKNLKRCEPTRDTNHAEKFQECLGKEWEWDFDMPHTLLIEATKPAMSI